MAVPRSTTADRAHHTRRVTALGPPLLAVCFAVVIVVVLLRARPPATVHEITVRNPHRWDAHIAVSSDGTGVLGLGTVGRQRTSAFQDVIDHGRRWVFSFQYGGVDGGTLVLTRTQLDRTDWAITVPDA